MNICFSMKAIFPYVVIGCIGCVALALFLIMAKELQSENLPAEITGGNRAIRVEIARNPGRTMPFKEAKTVAASQASVLPRTGTAISDSTCQQLVACVGDDSAAPAARVMAVHLCGERRLAAARASLSALADASSTPTPLRLAARNALGILANVGTL